MTDQVAPAAVEAGKKDLGRLPLIAAGLLVALLAAPFALNLAGDAQVHLAIAEAFAAGHPFQYNPGGEIVVASTSPFWTMLLALLYRLVGPWTPALLPVIAVGFWLSAGYVLYRAARDLWRFNGLALWGVMLLWLAHTTIVANALGGLENVAAALQLLLLYYLTADGRQTTAARGAAIGLVLGWALLTRPDGGLFALLLVVLWLPILWTTVGGRATGVASRSAVGHLLLIALAAAVVLLPWYAYQYAQTGQLLTDSSIARLYNGRMGSLMLIPGRLYLHPKALISLATAFLPLSAGFLVTAVALLARFIRARSGRLTLYRETFPQIAAVLLVIAGVLFYTFVVGAEAFGRYFLPLFPFFFLAGVAGLATIYDQLAAVGGRATGVASRSAVILLSLAILFLAATSAIDAYRRLGPGRFAPERALDVIYGPANLRYYSANVPLLVAAPRNRTAYTDGFLRDLGAPLAGGVSIAVTEVQLRYFLDDRVTVLSLDGRTSADILTYIDPTTGVPDFARYFQDVQPDYMHARQWCVVGGWLARVWPSAIEENLVCAWERRAAAMAVGDSFDWQGRRVTLVAPEILRIDWSRP
jgi:hypothetical protein